MLRKEIELQLDGPVGPLEALYFADQEQPVGIALVCHPNPVQGGTMLNKVVSTLQRTARDAGYITLRFNYRGVGKSAGEHDMGDGEVADAQAALAWLQAQHPDLPCVILGFSFGGCVAARVTYDQEQLGRAPDKLFMVAPSVERLAGHALPSVTPLTIIQPMEDEVVDPATVYAFSETLGRDHELLKVAECGHFFHGKLVQLKDLVAPRL